MYIDVDIYIYLCCCIRCCLFTKESLLAALYPISHPVFSLREGAAPLSPPAAEALRSARVLASNSSSSSSNSSTRSTRIRRTRIDAAEHTDSSSSSSSSDSEAEVIYGGGSWGPLRGPRYSWLHMPVPRSLLQQTLKELLAASEKWDLLQQQQQHQQQQQQQQETQQENQIESYAGFLARMTHPPD